MQNFNKFNFRKELLDSLRVVGYEKPTQIQEKSINHIMDGNDIIACAQTGTGKTAAFALPILNKIERSGYIQALIVTPTRELAIQIKENISEYSKFLRLKTVVIYGGVKQGRQVRSLQQGADILIATPGRLLDLINQGYVDISKLNYFVLDEADNMLDMGFIHDIRKILKFVPKKRQTLMFSATMPKEIRNLANTILTNPIEISVDPVSSAVDIIKQKLYYVNKSNKVDLLLDIMEDKKYKTTLIFTRTKRGADKLAKSLKNANYKVGAIHGSKSQNNRQITLDGFKNGSINTLVATDVAARGLDIDDLSYVINYDIPNIAETYIHRIGRTGRAGKIGEAISLCDHEEKKFIKDIQKLMKKEIEIVYEHNYPLISVQENSSKTSEKTNKSKPKTKHHTQKKTKSVAKNKKSSSSKNVKETKKGNQNFKGRNSNINKKGFTNKSIKTKAK